MVTLWLRVSEPDIAGFSSRLGPPWELARVRCGVRVGLLGTFHVVHVVVVVVVAVGDKKGTSKRGFAEKHEKYMFSCVLPP